MKIQNENKYFSKNIAFPLTFTIFAVLKLQSVHKPSYSAFFVPIHINCILKY